MKTRGALLALSVVLGIAVALAYGGLDAFARMAQLPLWPLAAGLLMILLGWQANAARLRLLVGAIGVRLTQREAFSQALAIDFAFAATPAGAGGLLTYVHLLRRRGVPGAQAAALCTVDQLFDLVFFLSLLPLLAVLLLGGYAPVPLQHPLALLAAALAGGLGLLGLALWKYRRALLFAGRVLRFLHVARARRVRLARGFVRFRRGVRLILALPRRRLFAVYALCAAHWLLRYSVLFVLARGAGAEASWATLVLVQMLALTAGQISGLPGGAGAVELAFGALMSRWLEPATAAAVLLEWRFALYYWYLLAGAPFFAAQLLRRTPHAAAAWRRVTPGRGAD